MEKSEAIVWLRRLGCSCVILGGDRLSIYRRRGVRDLLALLDDNPGRLNGAFVADKVVGKGAAAIMIAGGVCGVYAGVISRPALRLLRDASVQVEYDSLTDNIINRAATGICPVESLCLPCSSAAECLPLVREFVRRHSQVNVTIQQ